MKLDFQPTVESELPAVSNFLARTLELPTGSPIVAEVRGRGLMLALELAGEDLAPDPVAAVRFLEACRARGIRVEIDDSPQSAARITRAIWSSSCA